jgi:galactose mutarotase-like enzyme
MDYTMPIISFDHQAVLQLHDGIGSLELAPQFGGRLLRWSVAGRTVLHWPMPADWSNPARIRGGNPLLFPFVGRHFVDGQPGRWRAADGVCYPMDTHGFARTLPFVSELEEDGRAVRLSLSDTVETRAAFPFSFRFETLYRLDDAALEVEFVTGNTGETPLPYYPGHHFYFALPVEQRAATSLTLPPHHTRVQLPDGSPSPALAGAPAYRLDDAALLDRFHVLEARGTVRLASAAQGPHPGRIVTIALDQPGSVPWYAVTTWTERPDSPFYCVEPWLGLPDAIHHRQGLRWLAPGQTEYVSLRLAVEYA